MYIVAPYKRGLSHYRLVGSTVVSGVLAVGVGLLLLASPGLTLVWTPSHVYLGLGMVTVVCFVGPALAIVWGSPGFALMAANWMLACCLMRVYNQLNMGNIFPGEAYSLPFLGVIACIFMTVFCSWPVKRPSL